MTAKGLSALQNFCSPAGQKIARPVDREQSDRYETNQVLFISERCLVKLTRAAEYAVRCVLYLSGYPSGKVISRREVSSAMEIPGAFLGKIVQGLARAGILIVRQGASGGYELARQPRDISLLSVVEAIDGEILINECLSRPEACGFSGTCSVHRVWNKARQDFRETLRAVNFEALARRGICSWAAQNC